MSGYSQISRTRAKEPEQKKYQRICQRNQGICRQMLSLVAKSFLHHIMPMSSESQPLQSTATNDFSSEDYCGIHYAAQLLEVSTATVESLVEKGDIEAWRTQGGHLRLLLPTVSAYVHKTNPQRVLLDADLRGRLSVLIVEDDEDAREIYKIQFEDWGLALDCSFMPSALDALADISIMRPNLLITDMNMPGVDGMEMLRAIKRNPHLLAMQILVISGLPRDAIEKKGGLPPNSIYLGKPINFDWLQTYMTDLLATQRKGQ